MKNIAVILFVSLFLIYLTSCTSENVQLPKDSTETPSHQASDEKYIISEAFSLLEKGSIDSGASGSHGGQQTRICRTDHGTYAAFVSYQKGAEYHFYIVKTDESDNVKVIHKDKCPADAALVNIAQDNNGDVYVTAFPINTLENTDPQNGWLAMYIIDAENDTVTEKETTLKFDNVCSGGYGYAMPMFDFENRRIYAIYAGINDPGKFSWFTYDIDEGKWQNGCITAELDDMSHTYLYCFPDGNGGAFIVGERDIPTNAVPELKFETGSPVHATYLWDKLDLFIIPDMTKGDCEMVRVHGADYSRASEGIAPITTNNQYGDVFLDSNGLLHIIYVSYFADYDLPDGGESTAIKNRELRHAIYANGTCLYNELLKMQNENIPYGVRMTQNSNGELFLVAMTMGYNTTEHVEIYKASDTEGKEWELVKSEVLNGFTGVSFSISCPRNNSLCDDTVDCLAFGCYYIDSVYFTDLFKFSVKLH